MYKTPGQVAYGTFYEAHIIEYPDLWNALPDFYKNLWESAATAVIAHVTPQIRSISTLPSSIAEISSLLLQPEAEPVATVLGCDPYDERTGLRLSPDDWRRLNGLPKGTLLYAKEPAPQQMPVTSPAEQRLDRGVGSLSAVESGPTPETDAIAPHLNLSRYEMRMVAYQLRFKCKDLERQRNQLRAENERLRAKVAELDGLLSKRPCQFGRCVEYNKIAGMK